MSILDQAKDAYEKFGGPQKYHALSAMIEQQGGMHALIDKFHQGGLRGTITSWISRGQNLPISADQIQKVLGSEAVKKYADKLGVDPAQAAQQIAHVLPRVVDKLTPNGQVPSEATLQSAFQNLLSTKGDEHAA